jgi:FkbM family methyltransferase
MPESSNVLRFIEAGCRVDLVEPDPDCVARLREHFADNPNVTVHAKAIYSDARRLTLYRARSSTFAAVLPSSPALVNDRYTPEPDDAFEVDAVPFDAIDDGTIDLLSVDTEGCEWPVLQRLVSRPAVMSIETHGKRYRNPFMREIEHWTRANGYRVWYRDKSDTVYVREGHVSRGRLWRSRLARE